MTTTGTDLTRYQRELLDCVDNIKENEETEKYRVTCCYCGETFESKFLEKALNREGVHRSKEHVTKESITMSKGERDKDLSLLDTWKTIDEDRTVIDLIWWTTPTQVMQKRCHNSPLLNQFKIHYKKIISW